MAAPLFLLSDIPFLLQQHAFSLAAICLIAIKTINPLIQRVDLKSCGDYRTRTGHLQIANLTLYQMS